MNQKLIEQLGYTSNSCIAVLHADDIGMCESTISAYIDIIKLGLPFSASIVTTSPWLPEVARICYQYQQYVDIGVHLTMTSEWSSYRWRGISNCKKLKGLQDKWGFLPKTTEEVHLNANQAEVLSEARAQTDLAFKFGLSPSHLDAHMGVVYHPKFFDNFISLALELGVLPIAFGCTKERLLEIGFNELIASFLWSRVADLQTKGLLLLDDLIHLQLERNVDMMEVTKKTLNELKPGISHIVFHPAVDTPELRAIAPDWPGRVAHYELLVSKEFRSILQDASVHFVRYSEIAKLLHDKV